jgi:hypothetical protein
MFEMVPTSWLIRMVPFDIHEAALKAMGASSC